LGVEKRREIKIAVMVQVIVLFIIVPDVRKQ
jgi:hypothetical protein